MPKDIVLSTKTFIISHMAILLIALTFFGGLYYILYQDKFTKDPFQYIPVTKEPVSLFLEVSSPEDDILVSDANVIISGKTGPDNTVVISSASNDAALQSGKGGEFSKVFPLSPGANIIEIIAFDKDGNSKSAIKSVYYSEEKL